MLKLKEDTLESLNCELIILKSLRPSMYGNKVKLNKLNYLIDKVTYQMRELESKMWVRKFGTDMFSHLGG